MECFGTLGVIFDYPEKKSSHLYEEFKAEFAVVYEYFFGGESEFRKGCINPHGFTTL